PEVGRAGSTLTYTLSAVNTGPSVATDVVLADELPGGLTLLPDGISAPAGVTCTVTADPGTVSCAIGDLAPGQGRTVTLRAQVPGDTDRGTELTNTATLTSPTPSQNPDGRTASTTTTVDTAADLSIAKTAESESPIAGSTENYVLTVVNHGPSLARAVTVTDTLPEAVTFVEAVGDCAVDDGVVSCDVGDLALGQIQVLQLTVRIDDNASGEQITDVARVASDTTDPQAGNNSATLTQPVSGQNDLELAKTVAAPLVAGGDVTYTLRVTNNGPSQARAVDVVDLLPVGLSFVAAEAGDGGGCQYEPLPVTPDDDDQVRCNWDVLEVGESATATVTLAVPSDLTGSVVNTATATSLATDPTPAIATTTTPITTSAALSATKSLLSGAPIAGEEVRWQVLIRSAGPSVAQDVRLTDHAPTGIRFTGAQTAQVTARSARRPSPALSAAWRRTARSPSPSTGCWPPTSSATS
ncbi:MAG: DUF11 domain-containing protein, partial [Microlunatus sp.]|nr:DUF11 domain-containing protein [Microlunatus sp.]